MISLLRQIGSSIFACLNLDFSLDLIFSNLAVRYVARRCNLHLNVVAPLEVLRLGPGQAPCCRHGFLTWWLNFELSDLVGVWACLHAAVQITIVVSCFFRVYAGSLAWALLGG